MLVLNDNIKEAYFFYGKLLILFEIASVFPREKYFSIKSFYLYSKYIYLMPNKTL